MTWLDEQNDPGADQAAKEFKALSDADQKKFLGYLVDKASLGALAQAATGDLDGDPEEPEGTIPVSTKRLTLAGGDVEVTSEQGVKPESPNGEASTLAKGKAGDWSCYYNATQKILGVTITSLNFKQWYHSTTKKVDKVYNADATKTNWNVGVAISKSLEKQWISAAGNALAYVTWTGNIVHKGVGGVARGWGARTAGCTPQPDPRRERGMSSHVPAAPWGDVNRPARAAATPGAVAGWALVVVMSQVVLASIPVSVILAFTKLRSNHLAVRLGVIALGVAMTVTLLMLATTTGTAGAS